MFSSKSARSRFSKKLVKRGWSGSEAELAAYCVFPMDVDPRHRGLEDFLRSRADEMNRVLHKNSQFGLQEQRDLVAAALAAYAGASSEAGVVSYEERFRLLSEQMQRSMSTSEQVAGLVTQHAMRNAQIDRGSNILMWYGERLMELKANSGPRPSEDEIMRTLVDVVNSRVNGAPVTATDQRLIDAAIATCDYWSATSEDLDYLNEVVQLA